MSVPASAPPLLRTADLSPTLPTPFSLVPEGAALDRLAQALDLTGLRKLRFEGEIRAEGKRDWRLSAKLGATVVQPCVVTLDPVTTRIDVGVDRLFLADYAHPDGAEVEMPEDDSVEPLPPEIDLAAIMEEALALHLPAYPRKEGVDLPATTVTEPGKTPLTDDDLKPFAGLAALRDQLGGTED